MSRNKRARARIEAQRRRLQKAQSILLCAMWAARQGVEAEYDDVMDVVVEMIDDAVNALEHDA